MRNAANAQANANATAKANFINLTSPADYPAQVVNETAVPLVCIKQESRDDLTIARGPIRRHNKRQRSHDETTGGSSDDVLELGSMAPAPQFSQSGRQRRR